MLSGEVYNPWSIINYVKDLADGPKDIPMIYWPNTNFNDIVRTLIDRANAFVKFEILEIHKDKVLGWFGAKTEELDRSSFYEALLRGDTQRVQEELTLLLKECISLYNNAEVFYHGFILGLLSGMKTCIIK